MGEAKKFLEQLQVKRKTNDMLKKMDKPPIANTNNGEGFNIPNHSGQHTAGTTGTPVNDFDIANKKYVDDNSGGIDWTDATADWKNTGTFDLDLTDNTASAFVITQGTTGYICCDTTNGSEAVKVGCGGSTAIAEITSTGLEVTGNISLSGTVDGIDIATDVAANTLKVSFDWDYDYDDLINTPTTITSTQASAITANTAKTGITSTQASAITANTAKISYNSTASTKLGTIEESADVTDATNVVSALSAATLTGALTAADHGTAATDQVVNVCYGTGTAPTANTTTIGTLFIKYTA